MNTVKYLSVILLLILSSCKENSILKDAFKKNKNPVLPTIAGKFSEVLIVVDNDDWNSKVGEEYQKVFGESYQVIPQYEPVFDIFNINYEQLDKTFKIHRNIILTQIDPKYTNAKVFARYDIWAHPQIVINIQAADKKAFIEILNEKKEDIFFAIEEKEIERQINGINSNLDNVLRNKIIEEHHIVLSIERGFKEVGIAPNFYCVRRDIGTATQGIFIYYYPYTDTNTFTKEYLIKKRDSIVKKRFEGPVEGSYMLTETEYGPIFNTFNLNNNRYIAELRGLWKMEKIAMGGPFISYTTLDKKRNRVVTVEGFVEASGLKKRNYTRQTEAILRTMKIIGED